MLNVLRGIAAGVLCLGLSFSTAWAEDDTEAATFTLVNGTSAVIDEFFASPPSTESWENDILGQDTLAPGESVTITINDGREDCSYDFRAVFEDGTDLVHDAVSICNGESYTYQ